MIALTSTSTFAEVPRLNSDANAPHTIYLDFDGHVEPKSKYTCPPPLNGTPEGWPIDISVTDISRTITATQVREIWEAVSEDFAPFNVNVTTDAARAPGSETANALRIAIGGLSTDHLGLAPSGCEDLLANPPYLNPRIANVAVVALDPRTVLPRQAAAAISHEAGHLYGLAHHTAKSPTLLDRWIVAAFLPGQRYIWRNGENEFGRHQDDLAQLEWLLGRRPDELNPVVLTRAERITSAGTELSGFYANGTIAREYDFDDFVFTAPPVPSLTFRVQAGIWANPFSTSVGIEPNLRYRVEVLTGNGNVTIACPDSALSTLEVTSAGTVALGDCTTPPKLAVGTSYRVRVHRDARDALPGNVGRYTVKIDVPSWPPQPSSAP